MAQIDITEDGINVQLQGARRIHRRRPLVASWKQVTGVRADPELGAGFPGLKWGVGSYSPGGLSVGSFRGRDGLSFWDVKNPANTIVIDLSDHKYRRLVIEVDDPVGVIDSINRALQ